jgi:hypothetical protein
MQTTIPADAADFRTHLLPGEQILWAGRPAQGLLLTRRDGFMIPFSLVWSGFAVFWEHSVLHTNAPGFFKLWGIPFVAIGLYLVAGRFFLDAWLRRGMRYAVTSQRILILRPPPFGNFVAIELKRLPDATLQERADGSGTIRFGQTTTPFGRNGWSSWTPALDPTPQFLGVSDVRTVFDLVQREAANRG